MSVRPNASYSHRGDSANQYDRRVKKTKTQLRDSLFKLLESKSINQITVSELTKLANVNRSTFYFYYQDIYDMFEQIQDEIYSIFVRDVISTDCSFLDEGEYTQYIVRFFEFCKDNYSICRFVTSNDCSNKLADKIIGALKKNIPDSTTAFSDSDPRYYLTSYAISAMLWTVIAWMNDGMKVPPREMAMFLSHAYVYGSVNIKSDFSPA